MLIKLSIVVALIVAYTVLAAFQVSIGVFAPIIVLVIAAVVFLPFRRK